MEPIVVRDNVKRDKVTVKGIIPISRFFKNRPHAHYGIRIAPVSIDYRLISGNSLGILAEQFKSLRTAKQRLDHRGTKSKSLVKIGNRSLRNLILNAVLPQ